MLLERTPPQRDPGRTTIPASASSRPPTTTKMPDDAGFQWTPLESLGSVQRKQHPPVRQQNQPQKRTSLSSLDRVRKDAGDQTPKAIKVAKMTSKPSSTTISRATTTQQPSPKRPAHPSVTKSNNAEDDAFERKLIAAMAQADAGVNPFLDSRKALMRGDDNQDSDARQTSSSSRRTSGSHTSRPSLHSPPPLSTNSPRPPVTNPTSPPRSPVSSFSARLSTRTPRVSLTKPPPIDADPPQSQQPLTVLRDPSSSSSPPRAARRSSSDNRDLIRSLRESNIALESALENSRKLILDLEPRLAETTDAKDRCEAQLKDAADAIAGHKADAQQWQRERNSYKEKLQSLKESLMSAEAETAQLKAQAASAVQPTTLPVDITATSVLQDKYDSLKILCYELRCERDQHRLSSAEYKATTHRQTQIELIHARQTVTVQQMQIAQLQAQLTLRTNTARKRGVTIKGLREHNQELLDKIDDDERGLVKEVESLRMELKSYQEAKEQSQTIRADLDSERKLRQTLEEQVTKLEAQVADLQDQVQIAKKASAMNITRPGMTRARPQTDSTDFASDLVQPDSDEEQEQEQDDDDIASPSPQQKKKNVTSSKAAATAAKSSAARVAQAKTATATKAAPRAQKQPPPTQLKARKRPAYKNVDEEEDSASDASEVGPQKKEKQQTRADKQSDDDEIDNDDDDDDEDDDIPRAKPPAKGRPPAKTKKTSSTTSTSKSTGAKTSKVPARAPPPSSKSVPSAPPLPTKVQKAASPEQNADEVAAPRQAQQKKKKRRLLGTQTYNPYSSSSSGPSSSVGGGGGAEGDDSIFNPMQLPMTLSPTKPVGGGGMTTSKSRFGLGGALGKPSSRLFG